MMPMMQGRRRRRRKRRHSPGSEEGFWSVSHQEPFESHVIQPRQHGNLGNIRGQSSDVPGVEQHRNGQPNLESQQQQQQQVLQSASGAATSGATALQGRGADELAVPQQPPAASAAPAVTLPSDSLLLPGADSVVVDDYGSADLVDSSSLAPAVQPAVLRHDAGEATASGWFGISSAHMW